ncbi:MAG: hypothetical protein ACLQDV_02900, partial [Candidatus Binataceae bacterium]
LSAESVTLLAVGYIYGGIWAPPPTGLSPVRTKASFAAPPHTGFQKWKFRLGDVKNDRRKQILANYTLYKLFSLA